MQRRLMKKQDLLLIGTLLAAAILLLVILYVTQGAGDQVVVTINREEYGRYPLSEDDSIPIGKTNTLEIKNGEAKMTWADCPDKLCVKMPAIKKNGETIICLPNKIVVTIEGKEKAEYDTLAK